MLSTAVVLISFNRPETTRRILDAIRMAAPTELFLIADGPRPDHPTDGDKCAAVRQVLEVIDWPCAVHRRYSPQNVGCEANVELGLDWVFEHVTEAIIFEDDCLPDPSFFPFCEEILARYEHDPRIMHVAGSSLYLPPGLFAEESYAFSAWAGVWGWATWRRAWQTHRKLFPRDHAEPKRQSGGAPEKFVPRQTSSGLLMSGGGRRYFRDVANEKDGKQFGWDSHWALTVVTTQSLAVTPAVNLIENVGFNEEATHTKSSRTMPTAQAIDFPLRHPPQVGLNENVERELERILVRRVGRLVRTLSPFVPRGPIRTIARIVRSGTISAWLMRAGSRIRPFRRPKTRSHTRSNL